MKLYVDDMREAPDKTWVRVPNASRALSCLLSNEVTELSLDHDLGEVSMTGYDIAKQMVALSLWPKDISCHSMNPVGRHNILALLKHYAPEGVVVHD